MIGSSGGYVRAVIRSYTRAMRLALKYLAGIDHEVRGRDRLPEGAFIVGAKHQSWGDGFLIYPEIRDLVFVTGDHLEKIPLVKGILTPDWRHRDRYVRRRRAKGAVTQGRSGARA